MLGNGLLIWFSWYKLYQYSTKILIMPECNCNLVKAQIIVRCLLSNTFTMLLLWYQSNCQPNDNFVGLQLGDISTLEGTPLKLVHKLLEQ